MSTENTSVEPNDDLDTFSAEFFGQDKAQPEEAIPEEKVSEVVEESDATPEDTQTEGDDTPLENEDDDSEVDEQPKPKKNRAQERIEELNKKYRETERQLAELREKFEKQNEKVETPVVKTVEDEPSPSAKNEDGTDKYPLGEFDPDYIKDLTVHLFKQERKALEDEQRQALERNKIESARTELQESWEEKLNPARERYPDFQEKGEELISTFSDLDSNYGEYLAQTLMQMEYGPDVLYYLANNPDEASKIVQSGAVKATIALGRLETKFAQADEEKQKARPRVSQAPVPPPHLNKGAAVAKIEVSDDTDDLDAFASKFFKRRS